MQELIGLDFETYSAVPINKHGLHRYVSDDSFTVLIACLCWSDGSQYFFRTIDFTTGFAAAVKQLDQLLLGKRICAHNAEFEQRVLETIGIRLPASRFIDSAVLARAAGAGSKLEAAAPQLLNVDKLDAGKQLIKLFSIPGKLQAETDSPYFDRRIIDLHPKEWNDFEVYCRLDARLSLELVQLIQNDVPTVELQNQAITMEMNRIGWPVDVPLVEEMQRRYLENQEQALADFRAQHNADDLNLNSLKQMKEWCQARGVKATSFDEKHVEKLRARIEKKLESGTANRGQQQNYGEVLDLLKTKQILGGSSLKKLQVILNTVSKDGRLRDQYLHVGAGQSYRTSGRSVQMQNLKRLAEPEEMSVLFDDDTEWDNTKLAENMRQVFTSSHSQGRLIVGDFSSVESRGLAWLAAEQWKLDAYAQGKDMYKVLASSPDMFNVPYDQVTKPQRQSGKVGELSCGYGAGGGAVQSFAAGMGIEMSEGEATQLVFNWRGANPQIVQLWAELDRALEETLENNVFATVRVGPQRNHKVRIYTITTPLSLQQQHPGARSIGMDLVHTDGTIVLTRVFHGMYRRGRNWCYYKPSERKTGDLWRNNFTDPKTKQLKFYSLYGGKLAGILTQSFCRELFFAALRQVHLWSQHHENVELIGQFHDEIVLDWVPGPLPRGHACDALERMMSDPGKFSGFPLAAEVKHDYRYTK